MLYSLSSCSTISVVTSAGRLSTALRALWSQSWSASNADVSPSVWSIVYSLERSSVTYVRPVYYCTSDIFQPTHKVVVPFVSQFIVQSVRAVAGQLPGVEGSGVLARSATD